MVLRNEVAFKLTPDTIESLVEYHKEIHCVDAKSKIWNKKVQQCNKLHEKFVQAINEFVFRTHITALEGLEEEGAGELLGGKADEVKNKVLDLMKPLLPSSPGFQATTPQNMAPVDAWRILTSSPSMSSASHDSSSTPIWMETTCTDLKPPPTAVQPPSHPHNLLYGHTSRANAQQDYIFTCLMSTNWMDCTAAYTST